MQRIKREIQVDKKPQRTQGSEVVSLIPTTEANTNKTEKETNIITLFFPPMSLAHFLCYKIKEPK